MSGFKSLPSYAKYTFEIKKSEFISTCKMVSNESEAMEFVEHVREMHPKATHNCYAYSILDDGLKQKASDDGEPSGTAGLPILKAITMNELINVVIVVTRYYGGIKLGAGGLTRAYMAGATGLIEKAGIREFKKHVDMDLLLSYELYDILLDYLKKNNIKVLNTDFKEQISISIRILLDDEKRIVSDLIDLTSANVEIYRKDEVYE